MISRLRAASRLFSTVNVSHSDVNEECLILHLLTIDENQQLLDVIDVPFEENALVVLVGLPLVLFTCRLRGSVLLLGEDDGEDAKDDGGEGAHQEVHDFEASTLLWTLRKCLSPYGTRNRHRCVREQMFSCRMNDRRNRMTGINLYELSI